MKKLTFMLCLSLLVVLPIIFACDNNSHDEASSEPDSDDDDTFSDDVWVPT